MTHEHKRQTGPRGIGLATLPCPVCGVETDGHTHDIIPRPSPDTTYPLSVMPMASPSKYWVLRPCGHKATMDYESGELREWKP